MAGATGQRLRILYIRDYLEQNSDESHYVTTGELIKYLESKGVPCDRKTVYADIQSLMDYGLDIENHRGSHGGYCLLSGSFQIPELKLLIDSVQSARFLTQRKCADLTKKLLKLCSRHDQELVSRQMVVSGRVKNMNESIYYNLDTIQTAIAQGKKITFRYFNRGVGYAKEFRPGTYEASPYALCLDSENYYLLAHTDKHGVTHYRVDRMERISISDEARTPCKDLSPEALKVYGQKVFQMFSGETVRVKLRFANHLSGVVYDRFGQEAMLIPDGEGHFTFTCDVAVSPMFLSWVLGFGRECEIVYPQSVRESCIAYCRDVLNMYEGN